MLFGNITDHTSFAVRNLCSVSVRGYMCKYANFMERSCQFILLFKINVSIGCILCNATLCGTKYINVFWNPGLLNILIKVMLHVLYEIQNAYASQARYQFMHLSCIYTKIFFNIQIRQKTRTSIH